MAPAAPVVETPAAPAAPAQPVWTPPAYAYGPAQTDPAAPAATQQAAFADPFAPAQPEPAKPKKKGKGLLIAGIALVAAAAVFVTCVAGPLWFGWFPNTKLAKQVTKWFGSDEAYMSAVESETVETLSDSISKGYGNMITTYKDIINGDKYVSSTISLELGDTVKTLLESAITESAMREPGMEEYVDLVDLLDGASISMSGGRADDVYKMAMGLGLGGEQIVDLGVIMDLANLKAFMAVPTLSDTYIEISQIFEELDVEDLAAVGQAMDLLDALPSEDVVNKLLKKYIQLALDQFDNVSKDSDTIKVGGIEEKVTVLKTKIGPKDLVKAGKALVKELKKDSDVKNILLDLGDAMGALEGQDGYGQMLYDSLIEGLEEAEATLDEYSEYADEADGSYVILTDYVNGSHEIIGRKVSVQYGEEKQEMLYYATATKGDDFAFVLEVREQKLVSGKGTNKKGIINGTYTIDGAMVMGMDPEEESVDLVTIKVSDFDSNGVKENNLKGSFTIRLSEEAMQMVIDEAELPSWLTSSISLLDCGLKVDVDLTADGNGYCKYGVFAGTETLVAIRMDMKVTDEQVSVPSSDKTIDMENIEQWLETVDLTKLVQSLVKIGVPEELTDMLEQTFDEALNRAEDDYDDIYGDDYYDDVYGDDDYDDVYGDDYYDDYYGDEYGSGVEDIPVDDWYENPDEYLGEPIYGADGRIEGYI